ncbi:putative lipase atg15 [Podila epigama]|nr:putative lipase atg15 [Podila epigama]
MRCVLFTWTTVLLAATTTSATSLVTQQLPLAKLSRHQDQVPFSSLPQQEQQQQQQHPLLFSPQKHALKLQHIIAHGEPGTKHGKVFRRLKVDAKIRSQLSQDSQSMLYSDGSARLGSTFEHVISDSVFVTDDENMSSAQRRHLQRTSSFPQWPWVRVPDPADHATVVSMIRMALDCYVDPMRQGWVDIGDNWDVETEIGWLEAGLRGYVFSSEDEKTVVIGLKGTSLKLFGTGGGPTGNNDKLNDNKMFSCCCGKVDRTWWGVCGCYMGGSQCNQQCLVDDVTKDKDEKESYYGIGLKVVDAARALYPKASIWLTGHSLGGSVASLLGVTNGYPTFTFQSPGDALYAKRVGIVKPQLTESDLKKLPVWQFGHTADPIFMGTCNGASSTCYTAGYAMEAKCHLGKICVYDTMGELGWHRTIQAHTIFTFINVVEHWANMTAGKNLPEVPECSAQVDCQDCSQWEFV